ncbi:coatamer subunit protein [Niveomyces insectorum RCEF 264]|uniref:Coatamer subunit protein n=1 Tax=Niveomyces insectorum RCEF 264 TaxID=1081102 RepID=A0A167ZVE8_9HYPO|nr:coatamer subunit protein [Niveomyces insectorum RCEF 264]
MASNFNARFPPKPATKKSIFERQRAELEAKRQREAAETAAVYEDFVKSFDDDGGHGRGSSGGGGGSGSAGYAATTRLHPPSHAPPAALAPPPSGVTVGSAGGRRHFSMPTTGPTGARNSGPGSLGPGASAGSHSSGRYHDRRHHRDEPGRRPFGGSGGGGGRRSDEEEGAGDELGMQYAGGGTGDSAAAASAPTASSDRSQEKAVSKPTIRLANLPPGTSPAAVKALVASGSRFLTVDSVRMLPAPPPPPSGTAAAAAAADRKSVAAIVMLSAETAGSDIDAVVSALQNRYLGFGYYLTLHRHLSSAVVAAAAAATTSLSSSSASSAASSQPFGAKPVSADQLHNGPRAAGSASSLGFAPPPSYHGVGGGGRGSFGRGRGGHGAYGRGFPPPSTYDTGNVDRSSILYVPVRPPRDIKTLRMIHKVVEGVLDQGPAFEALLMSRPEVQRDEKWAWIWDARSEAGVWYRYRLWATVTGHQTQRGQGKYVPLFEGSSAWKVPGSPLPYEFDTNLAEFVSGSEYNSSDDSEFDDDDDRHHNNNSKNHTATPGDDNDKDDVFLNPMEKARLVHLLARLPTALAKVRKGDVARVTAFAVAHASRGADEIVDLIVSNIERPFAYTAANPTYQKPAASQTKDGTSLVAGGVPTTTTTTTATTTTTTPTSTEVRDTSGAQLIAVYVVSDLLSSSATSGVRHAWRFRQLFEAALRRRKVFEGLGLLAERLHWGRLRADKWKRSVGLVLSHWEGWSVFSAETQAYLVESFEHPPSAKKDEGAPAAAAGAAGATGAAGAAAKKGRWKTVDTTAVTNDNPPSSTSGFKPVTGAAEHGQHDGVETAEEVLGQDADAAENDDDDDDEWAYRSEYTDDEELDLACLEGEDIDGEPLDDNDNEGDEAVGPLDGTPLTADEIAALCGEVVEMSEEGEIGSDDDAYAMSGLSGVESGSEDGGGGNNEEANRNNNNNNNDDDDGDVEMGDAGSSAKDRPPVTQQPGRTTADEASATTAATRAEQKAVDNAKTATAARKRMRAVDMFADSDGEGEGEGDE